MAGRLPERVALSTRKTQPVRFGNHSAICHCSLCYRTAPAWEIFVNVQCFVLEDANLARRYAGAGRSVYDNNVPRCMAYDGGYHSSDRALVDTVPYQMTKKTDANGAVHEEWDISYDDLSLNDDSLPWPTHCRDCGYEFAKRDRFFTVETLYRLPDGTLLPWQKAPVGAIQIAPWLDHIYKPQLEHCINVLLPDRTWWTVDGQSSNCGMPDDTRQERHHCWVIEGSLPNITVGKTRGPTCSAGAGSILTDYWHGFLRNGVLEQC